MACEEPSEREDWRSDRSTLSEHLWCMYQNDLSVDLTIAVMFKCHKVVMRRLTPIFDPPKDGSEQSILSLDAGSLDPDVFSAIIQFAYTDQLEVMYMRELIAIHKLATLYRMDQIRKECNKLFVYHTNMNSIWGFIDYILKETDLAHFATTFLSKSTSACLKSPNFLNSSQEVLKFVLDQEELNVNEMQLINAVIQWAKHKNSGANLDPERSSQLLGPCLSQIRFLCLTASEFSEKIPFSGLLSKEDCLYILIKLASKQGKTHLPDYICKLETRRIKEANVGQGAAKSDQTKNPIARCQSLNVLNGPSDAVKAKKKVEQPKKIESTSVLENMLVLREIDPKFKLTMFLLKTPGESNLEIRVSKPVILRGVRLATQMKKLESEIGETYKEEMYVRLIEMVASNNKTQKYYHTYSRDAKYGPDQHFDVIFKTPQKLKPCVPYIIQLTLCQPGEYHFNKRLNEILLLEKDLIIQFGSKESDTCEADPLLGIFLETTTM